MGVPDVGSICSLHLCHWSHQVYALITLVEDHLESLNPCMAIGGRWGREVMNPQWVTWVTGATCSRGLLMPFCPSQAQPQMYEVYLTMDPCWAYMALRRAGFHRSLLILVSSVLWSSDASWSSVHLYPDINTLISQTVYYSLLQMA